MKLPNAYYNRISFYGTLLAGFSLVVIIFLYVVTKFFYEGGAYVGLIIFIAIPIFLVIGLIMIPYGMWRKVRRERKMMKEDTKWKIIDLTDKKTRNAMIIFVIGTFIFLFVSSIGSYQAFHYTESNEFCGTLCHKVMSPEYVAYQQSSHARVKCVECHVGEGADWYVKSKLSGMYQVYSVLFSKYPTPIPAAVHNLRPARETCEKCHWPNKFYANRIVHNRSYLANENNTECNITLKMKTSPKLSAHGLEEGIHWHINPNVKIEYVTNEEFREHIQWVKYTNTETGDVVIYQDEMNTLPQEAIDSLEVRTMDCMDCHNRPSHLFNSPTDFIDDAINKGTVAKDLPYIKMIAMQVIKPQLGTTDSALTFIKDSITSFYKENHPEIYSEKQDLIEKAIAGIEEEFLKNCFPEMKVYNFAYLNHIGHQESLGCFRCHSGTHVSESGKYISKDCNLCHTIIAQQIDTISQYSPIDSSLTFYHPEDIGGAETEMHCSECHSALY